MISIPERLETKRLILTSPVPEQYDELVAETLSNPVETQYLTSLSKLDVGGWTKEDAMQRRLTQEESQRRGCCWNSVATLKTGEYIGFGGLRSIDHWNKSGEMGIIIKQEYWGKGYSTEIHLAVLEFSFESLELNRITFVTTSLNTPMNQFCKNVLRATHEGTLRDFMPIRSQPIPGVHNFQSCELYSILRTDWAVTKESLLSRL